MKGYYLLSEGHLDTDGKRYPYLIGLEKRELKDRSRVINHQKVLGFDTNYHFVERISKDDYRCESTGKVFKVGDNNACYVQSYWDEFYSSYEEK
jgi:hypothetical protein